MCMSLSNPYIGGGGLNATFPRVFSSQSLRKFKCIHACGSKFFVLFFFCNPNSSFLLLVDWWACDTCCVLQSFCSPWWSLQYSSLLMLILLSFLIPYWSCFSFLLWSGQAGTDKSKRFRTFIFHVFDSSLF